MDTCFLITGKPRVGKSTAIKRIIKQMGAEHFGGFYTEEIRSSTDRTGFNCMTLNGESVCMASVDKESPVRVGRYGSKGAVADMSKNEGVVIGIDGGGTHTRVMVADLEGKILSYVERGASSIHKDLQAKQNVHQAIQRALEESGKGAGDVMGLAAGMAGYDSEADLDWVQPLTDVEGLVCERLHVNDAVVAHSGALLSEPGVIVISGTGSIIFAVTEDGRQIRNYDLHHYAASAARFLAYDATYELLAGHIHELDYGLVQDILHYWELHSVNELSHLAQRGFVSDTRERNRKFAEVASFVTHAASQGSPLAQTVCDRAIHQIMVGVEMLAVYFSEPEVKVALIGGVVNSEYFEQKLAIRMSNGNNKRYRNEQPAFSPVAGAVLLALKRLGTAISPPLLDNLGLHPRSHHR